MVQYWFSSILCMHELFGCCLSFFKPVQIMHVDRVIRKNSIIISSQIYVRSLLFNCTCHVHLQTLEIIMFLRKNLTFWFVSVQREIDWIKKFGLLNMTCMSYVE